jgi:DNA-directed RNA polymerase subunit RPC12/RpoP
LCGDCGSPHELDTDLYVKPQGEDFYICEDCLKQSEETNHQENHAQEPNLDCWHCQE